MTHPANSSPTGLHGLVGGFYEMASSIPPPGSPLCVTGLVGSASAFLAAILFQQTQRQIVFLTSTPAEAERLTSDLSSWAQILDVGAERVVSLPAPENLPTRIAPPHPGILKDRMKALWQLALDPSRIIVTSLNGFLWSVPNPRRLQELAYRIRVGDPCDRDDLIGRLADAGYERTDPVEYPGQFSVRGGIVDFSPPLLDQPVRLEWLDDQIESVRLFDSATQISSQTISEVILLPFEETAEALEPLASYFDPAAIVMISEPERVTETLRDLAMEWESLAAGPAKGFRRPTETELQETLNSRSLIRLESIFLGEAATNRRAFEFRTTASLGVGQKGKLLSASLAILEELRQASLVVLTVHSPSQRDRFLDLCREHHLPALPWSGLAGLTAGTTGRQPFYIAVSPVSAGFADPDGGLVVATDEELFGKSEHHRAHRPARAPRYHTSIEDLRLGDNVVHIQHGIGRYEGLRRLTIQGFESDFLVIRYRGGDTLYVPLDQLGLVQRFTGSGESSPTLDRLGGSTWSKTTKRIKKEAETIAKDIVELYAARQVSEGHAASPDGVMSHEFEAAFEFDETPDQRRAIDDVRSDMERPVPMDRLVCGDVGYGKTEVAMRAAFKAVQENRQVAVLVPTTLLAQQHSRNFSERFRPFPVRVEMLSRFRTAAEQKAVLRDLETGQVDIVIGTHRLLQQDVRYKNLGLIVVDEEQRFGVRHKERLKQLRTSVDVLTLTATPIPRTLQMALVGMRDLSMIESPPADRLAIRTILSRFDREMIRTVVRREFSRSGQVFFVHNRVEDIERLGQFLREAIPEARIGVAHGQMSERMLERIMIRFVNGELNLLLCTSIIESGLDIPAANTILINNAHHFGLSDLYQLRGRVGRSGDQAYAYLLVPTDHALSGQARQRLEAIQEFCILGSGFRIAAKDLEIRGAGSLLGRQQSGHIAAVGLDYYLKLIEAAVKEMKGTPVSETREPSLNLKVSAFIPDEFIPEASQRLSYYKRLAGLDSEGTLAEIGKELEDRYGRLPDPVSRLLEVIALRILAKGLKISRMTSRPGGALVVFEPGHVLPESAVQYLMAPGRDKIRLSGPESFQIHLPDESWESAWPILMNCLKTLNKYVTSR